MARRAAHPATWWYAALVVGDVGLTTSLTTAGTTAHIPGGTLLSALAFVIRSVPACVARRTHRTADHHSGRQRARRDRRAQRTRECYTVRSRHRRCCGPIAPEGAQTPVRPYPADVGWNDERGRATLGMEAMADHTDSASRSTDAGQLPRDWHRRPIRDRAHHVGGQRWSRQDALAAEVPPPAASSRRAAPAADLRRQMSNQDGTQYVTDDLGARGELQVRLQPTVREDGGVDLRSARPRGRGAAGLPRVPLPDALTPWAHISEWPIDPEGENSALHIDVGVRMWPVGSILRYHGATIAYAVHTRGGGVMSAVQLVAAAAAVPAPTSSESLARVAMAAIVASTSANRARCSGAGSGHAACVPKIR